MNQNFVPETSQSINKTEATLLPGQTLQVDRGGAEVILWKIAGASEIDLSLDGYEYLPTAQGRGYRQPHHKIKIQNNNATSVEVVLLQSTLPGAFVDNQDTATVVQIGETPSVVNSPSIDDGGSVAQLGQSLAVKAIDLTGGADTDTTIISAGTNVGGIRIRQLQITYFTVGGANTRYVNIGNPVRSHFVEYLAAASGPLTFRYNECLDVPAGGAITIRNRVNDVLSLTLAFDHL